MVYLVGVWARNQPSRQMMEKPSRGSFSHLPSLFIALPTSPPFSFFPSRLIPMVKWGSYSCISPSSKDPQQESKALVHNFKRMATLYFLGDNKDSESIKSFSNHSCKSNFQVSFHQPEIIYFSQIEWEFVMMRCGVNNLPITEINLMLNRFRRSLYVPPPITSCQ